ncbi:hypothetical protein [Acinetobacter sp. YH1901134]|uniref:hypothetical protein n=1 Tax=Acinetobacter sp. YH1901134 TaxID=2601199 RepID=UPI0015D3FD1E|nr:hypothetical protein [Acinetobacter sp. YH1901134]
MSGLVKTNTSIDMFDLGLITDSTKLLDEIKKIENERSVIFEQNRPFIGLIQKDIRHVLNILFKELELGNFREDFWQQLFENIPESTTIEEKLIVANAIFLLPSEVIFNCRFSLSRWIDETLVNTCISNHGLFWKVWDYVFNSLNTIGPDATKSSIGEVKRGGKVINVSRKTLDYALNSPIGRLVYSLFSTFNAWKLDTKIYRKNYLSRFELALNSVGEGADHAAVMIAYRFKFIFYHYKQWTEFNLIPLLNIDNPVSESVWHGIMLETPSPKASLIIKPYITSLFKNKPEWLGSEKLKNNLAKYLVVVSYWSYPKAKYYSDIDLRNMIRNFDNDMLSHTLWVLQQLVTEQKNWTTFGRHFIKNIWPKEIIFQNSRTSERLLNLILETPDSFLDIYKHVMPYLGKIDSGSLFMFRLVKDDKIFLLEKYPEEVLLLLDKVIGSKIEYYDHFLKDILEKLISAKPTIKNHPSWRRLKEIAED